MNLEKRFQVFITGIQIDGEGDMKPNKQVWISFVHVAFRPGDRMFREAKGAYVNVLAWVSGSSEFRSKIFKAVDEYSMDLVSIDDVEPFKKRIERYQIDKRLVRLANEVAQKHNLRFHSFYTYLRKKPLKAALKCSRNTH